MAPKLSILAAFLNEVVDLATLEDAFRAVDAAWLEREIFGVIWERKPREGLLLWTVNFFAD